MLYVLVLSIDDTTYNHEPTFLIPGFEKYIFIQNLLDVHLNVEHLELRFVTR